MPDVESVLKESDVKLDAVRQKIAQIAEELRGEDMYQFHRAFTAGEFDVIFITSLHVDAYASEDPVRNTSKPCKIPIEKRSLCITHVLRLQSSLFTVIRTSH